MQSLICKKASGILSLVCLCMFHRDICASVCMCVHSIIVYANLQDFFFFLPSHWFVNIDRTSLPYICAYIYMFSTSQWVTSDKWCTRSWPSAWTNFQKYYNYHVDSPKQWVWVLRGEKTGLYFSFSFICCQNLFTRLLLPPDIPDWCRTHQSHTLL